MHRAGIPQLTSSSMGMTEIRVPFGLVDAGALPPAHEGASAPYAPVGRYPFE